MSSHRLIGEVEPPGRHKPGLVFVPRWQRRDDVEQEGLKITNASLLRCRTLTSHQEHREVGKGDLPRLYMRTDTRPNALGSEADVEQLSTPVQRVETATSRLAPDEIAPGVEFSFGDPAAIPSYHASLLCCRLHDGIVPPRDSLGV